MFKHQNLAILYQMKSCDPEFHAQNENDTSFNISEILLQIMTNYVTKITAHSPYLANAVANIVLEASFTLNK